MSAQSDDESDESECDLGETCLCFEPAKNQPEHLWKISLTGMVKLTNVLFFSRHLPMAANAGIDKRLLYASRVWGSRDYPKSHP